jgi:hypothetical protein
MADQITPRVETGWGAHAIQPGLTNGIRRIPAEKLDFEGSLRQPVAT